MLTTLVNKEILNNLLNRRFAVAYFLCTLLFVGSGLIMYADLLAEKSTADTSQRVYERRMLGSEEAGQFLTRILVARPVAAGQMFALGGERDADRHAPMAPEKSPAFLGDLRRDPLSQLFPAMDLTFVVGIVYSLLVFMLVYDAVSGERESGTLRVLLSCPVSRDRIMVAKWLGAFVSVIVPFLTSAAVVVLVLLVSRGLSLRLDDWLRIAGVLAVCLLYIAVVLSISLAVSALFRSSATGILALLLAWAVVIVAIPALSTPVAYLTANPASVQYMSEKMRQEASSRELRSWLFETAQKLQDEVFAGRRYEELSQEEQWEVDNAFRQTNYARLERGADGVLGQLATLTRAERSVDHLMRQVARFSPFGCLQNACVTLAGTDMEHELGLRETNSRYLKALVGFWRTLMAGDEYPWPFPGGRAPRYQFRQEPFAVSLARAVPDLGVLVLTGCVFFLVAFAGFLRLDPT